MPAKFNPNDTAKAFHAFSDYKLQQAYLLFKALTFNPLVKAGPRLATLGLRMGLPIKGIIEKTIFQQFCGGESITACQPTIAFFGEHNIGTILDYSAEGEGSEADYDATCEQIKQCIYLAAHSKNIPFCVFKPTGIGSVALMTKLSQKQPLTTEETAAATRLEQRFTDICNQAATQGVRLFIDAEESWIQSYIDEMAFTAMKTYNTTTCIIYNTIQMYRHDRLDFFKDTIKAAKKHNFTLGVKIVRGAYLEKENFHAAKQGITSPIHKSKADTDHAFDQAIQLALENLGDVHFCAGTHNEDSTVKLTTLLRKKGIIPSDERCYFAQLMGMSENLTFNLAAAGYRTAKYVPYGPVDKVLPYLSRRAQENSSVKGQSSRELELIRTELQRRKLKATA